MRVIIEGCGQLLTTDVEDQMQVLSLKEQISTLTHIPASFQRLVYQTHEFSDHQTLSELEISDLAVLHLGLKLCGGWYDPELKALANSKIACLICRKCYCHNGLERKTCRKCGCPDLRGKKQRCAEMKRFYPSKKYSHQ